MTFDPEKRVQELVRENEALNEQIKLLVQTEQRLYRSQNELDAQLGQAAGVAERSRPALGTRGRGRRLRYVRGVPLLGDGDGPFLDALSRLRVLDGALRDQLRDLLVGQNALPAACACHKSSGSPPQLFPQAAYPSRSG